tara:strand:- start:6662 stop:7099 length:438 start_codon:yes stop_codon:yes gene_type:complete
MGNIYKCVRLEPQCKYDNNDCVCNVVIGLTAEDGEGNSAYIDGVYNYPEGSMPTVAEFKEGANALVSQMAADFDWIASLDSQIESRKVQPKQAEDFEAPEITVDTSVEPAEGSPANPTPEPEPEPPVEVVEEEVVEETEEVATEG